MNIQPLTIAQVSKKELDIDLFNAIYEDADALPADMQSVDIFIMPIRLLEIASNARKEPFKLDCINLTDTANDLYKEVKNFNYLLITE
jgi:hypothetical protein